MVTIRHRYRGAKRLFSRRGSERLRRRKRSGFRRFVTELENLGPTTLNIKCRG
jgi:hypothetical protein